MIIFTFLKLLLQHKEVKLSQRQQTLLLTKTSMAHFPTHPIMGHHGTCCIDIRNVAKTNKVHIGSPASMPIVCHRPLKQIAQNQNGIWPALTRLWEWLLNCSSELIHLLLAIWCSNNLTSWCWFVYWDRNRVIKYWCSAWNITTKGCSLYCYIHLNATWWGNGKLVMLIWSLVHVN